MNALRLLPFLLFVFNAPLFCQDFNLGVLDLNDGDDEIKNLTSALGKLFFVKNGELWVSDGTITGSNNLEFSTNVLSKQTVLNGKLIFRNHYGNLCSTNGSIGGAYELTDSLLIADIPIGRDRIIDGKLYFFGMHLSTEQNYLMRTDGTPEGTEFLLTMGENGLPSTSFAMPHLKGVHDELFFWGLKEAPLPFGELVTELWKTDGTEEGTTMIVDLDTGNDTLQNNFLELGYFNDQILTNNYFYSYTDSSATIDHIEIWSTDGTEEGTNYLFDGNFSSYITPIGEEQFLSYTDWFILSIGNTLTKEYKAIHAVDDSIQRFNYEHTLLDDKVVYNQYSPIGELKGLWISDVTTNENTRLMDCESNINATPGSLLSVGDRIFFSCYLNGEINEFWFTDGTLENTYSIGTFEDIFINADEHILYNNRLYFIAENHEFSNTIHYLELEPNPNITGIAFYDLNENGIKEEGEVGISHIPITADDGQLTVAYTQEDGTYQFSILDSAIYQIRYQNQNHCWEPTASPFYYEIQLGDSVYQDLNFGFRSLQGAETAYLDVQSGPTRCGFTVPFWVNLHNTGCLPIEGEVHIQLDEMLTLVSYDEDELTVNGQQLIWSFDSITGSTNQQLHFELEMPGTEALGDTIFLETTAYIIHQDSLIDAGTYLYESVITCAYDPNDKLIRPSRPEESNSNYTQIDETLFYTIRFQNTGNDTAFTVRILDQLAPELDWETFQPLSASHAYKATLFPDGEVEFLFEDILLPDSIVNEPGSHGYVAFSIALKDGLEDFTAVKNTARIYFDYNEPIITNTTTNTIVEYLDLDEDGFYFWEDCDDENPEINPLAEEIPGNNIDEDCDGEIDPLSVDEITTDKIQLFPNPATNTLQLVSPAALSRIELLDAFGRTILTEQASLAKSYEIDITFLSQGVYFIRAYDSNQNLIGVEKVIKR
ncbi:MAG: T9SS type A sorting domain-containing protein [Chitinophagales bacterium]|nr:T9SS type A sorting domain-containing protein [Chitinophagales bacterium]